ncbi:nitronate monooxygenase [Noviherbaspirillum humi]|uniref:Nitronate monooxygenase n=1 Tax=Noviherbaspirillum humi TaxID=1688639 RepID=A0A239F8C4_9BURK|nr:nitronate monooxygenase [Noviherbaspirillum humi]SNS52738.1 nitronate monooxygenase [Noviherbaspirillum humi]
MADTRSRAEEFCRRFGLKLPILLAPMAGACPPSLSAAVMQAGGMGACGALLMQPAEIEAWAQAVRQASDAPFQINLWIPDPPPRRDAEHEARVRDFLSQWGPAVPAEAGDAAPPDFNAQCEALLALKPAVISSIMGVYPPPFVQRMKQLGIAWFATATTVDEALQAEAAGADVIVAQGMEAGGHRGSFEAAAAERRQVGLFALLPAIRDAVRLPVVATGGIADARGVAAAMLLGADAVQIGTGFLRSPEAKLATAWSDALAAARPEQTMLTRAFSGRAGRSIANDYARAAADAPAPAPYPVQRGLTAAMRKQAQERNDASRMQAWAGQSAALAQALPAAQIAAGAWEGAVRLLA